VEEALSLALRALGRKERTVAEMGSWLRQRGVADDEVQAVVGRLAEDGALDDARFAARYAADKRELAGWGNDRIRSALLDRGIAMVDVEAAIEDDEPASEAERAAALLIERRIPLRGERDRSRAFGFLMRRGYQAETAYEAIRRAARDQS
jgi:regulatory protein